MTVPRAIIHALPKAELHSHIDGSIPGRELFRIAKNNGRKLTTPNGAALDSVTAFMRYIAGDGYSSLLETIVDRFYPITNMMQTEGALMDAGVAYIREQKKEGVAYVEGRFAPQYHTKEGLSLAEVIRSMAEGLAKGSEEFGVKSSLILAIGRESTPELGVAVARAAAASRRAVALDLGGPEIGNPPGRFRDAFKIATESGMKVTVHAGEGAGSRRSNLAYIEAAITELGANRIGHAIDLASDGRMIALVKERSVAIELNPISNLVLRKIKDLQDLSIDQLLRNGIVVSLNSDDPALWPGGRLTDVYTDVCRGYGFGPRELDQLAENAFKSAFCSEETKDSLADEYMKARRRLL